MSSAEADETWGTWLKWVRAVMKDNCRSFVVRRGGLLRMTGGFAGGGALTANTAINFNTDQTPTRERGCSNAYT